MLMVGFAMLLSASVELKHEAQEVFDAGLAQSALLVQALLPKNSQNSSTRTLLLSTESELSASILEQTAAERETISYYENDTVIIIQSAAREKMVAENKVILLPIVTKEGFSRQFLNDELWVVFSLLDTERNLWISSAQQEEIRSELSDDVAMTIIPAFAIGTLVICIALFFSVRKGLSPLYRISKDLNTRHSDNLTPISIDNLPSELKPTVISLNKMFAKVSLAVMREQNFTDDAAHELRTPLAAMLVHLDALPDNLTRKALYQGVDNMKKLVNQLLELARLSPTSTDTIELIPIDLHSIAAQVIAHLYPSALAKDMSLELMCEPKITVLANRTLLEILLANLVENAIRYSKNKDLIQVVINRDKQSFTLRVIDHGQGISDADKQKVWSRFYRCNQSAATGSGLGLSIVQEIAQLHRGHCDIQDTLDGGATFSVQIPADSSSKR